jgi:hypothetical protein
VPIVTNFSSAEAVDALMLTPSSALNATLATAALKANFVIDWFSRFVVL